MFTAMVLACVIGQANVCIEATDTLGPYKTQQECILRAHNMIAALSVTLPLPHQYLYKCDKQESV